MLFRSATPDFKAGQMCAQGISPSVVGDTLTMLCPVTSFTTRYVTVMRNVTNSVLSLQEITAMYDGRLGLKVQVMTCSPEHWHCASVCVFAVLGPVTMHRPTHPQNGETPTPANTSMCS